MASTAEEDTGQSSSDGTDDIWSQPPQAGPPEPGDDSCCPICLGPVQVPAFVTYCMHKFCLSCIWQWARNRDTCPVCRQPVEKMLYSVRGDGDYKEYSISLFALQRRIDRDRDMQPVATFMRRVMQTAQDQQRLPARRRHINAERLRRQRAAPEPYNAPPQMALAAPQEMSPLGEGETGPAAPPEPQNGSE